MKRLRLSSRQQSVSSVGVVVVSHTQRYLDECLDSIAGQRMAPTRLIVIDNGSLPGDRVIDVCNERQVFGHRFNAPISVSAARNYGITLLADCETIVCFDGDDVMKPDFLKTSVEAMQRERVDIVFSAAELFGNKSGVWFPGRGMGRRPNLRNRNTVPVNALFRRNLWERTGGFDPDQLFFEDWDYWLSCAAAGASFYGIAEPLWGYRRHTASLVGSSEPAVKDAMRTRIWHKHLSYIRGPLQWRRGIRIIEKGYLSMKKNPLISSPIRMIGGRLSRFVGSAGPKIRRRLFPKRPHPPLYEGSVVDDLLWGQGFNPIMRAIWFRGKHRRSVAPGTTVVIVSWNTIAVLKNVLQAVRSNSPSSTQIIVIDNGSTDGTKEWLQEQRLTDRCVLLPFNIGHGRGLDIGFALAKTETVVTMDSDAFPFSTTWLDTLSESLEQPQVQAAGMWGRRDRLHPACAAFRRQAFYDARCSFNNYTPWMDRNEPPVWGENSWDTAELLFERIGTENVRLLPVTRTEHGGITMEGGVYHHEAMTTVRTDHVDQVIELRQESWDRAVEDLLAS